jgi:23S rRNA pseudouridine1911/1915/1917 synthase
VKIINVNDDKADIRIDIYLIDELGCSRSKAQKLIENGNVIVNDKNIKNSYIVRVDDEIKIDGEVEEVVDAKPENIPLEIVYEDDDVIVVNKPSGMVVHPAAGHYTGTLVNALLFHCNHLSGVNGNMRPGIIHRIDKDTSGLLLVAKTDTAHAKLAEDLKNKKVTRRYVALVEGVIQNDYGTIDAPIGRDLVDRKKKAITDINSKEAITHFTVIERLNNATLIECRLETGRTHQIRLHMKYINHPVINDPVYNNKKVIDDFGQMLHAKVLGFNHPRTGEYMEFSAELPKKFVEILNLYR